MNISKNRLFSGIGYIIFGVLIVVGPQTLFPVCEAMGDSYMKCHWTAQAEIACGVVIVVLGVLLFCFSSEAVRIGLQIALLIQFLPVLLIPNALIGVCGGNHMRCHALTRPTLNVLGVVGIIAGTVNLVYLFKRAGRSRRKDETA